MTHELDNPSKELGRWRWEGVPEMAQAFLDYLTVYVAGYLFVLSAILDWTGQSLLTAQVYELCDLAMIKCSIFLINVHYFVSLWIPHLVWPWGRGNSRP